MKSESKTFRLTKLPPDLEAQLPESVQQIRKFYFSLSEKDKRKLEETRETKKDLTVKETKPVATESKDSLETLNRLLELLEKLSNDADREEKEEQSMTPAERRQRILERMRQKINRVIDDATKEILNQ